jgi:hypothetical protein
MDGANNPDAKEFVCEDCDGRGTVEAGPEDYDGLTVKVVATGFVGVASVFRPDCIIVMNDAEEEVVLTSIEEITHEVS